MATGGLSSITAFEEVCSKPVILSDRDQGEYNSFSLGVRHE